MKEIISDSTEKGIKWQEVSLAGQYKLAQQKEKELRQCIHKKIASYL